MNTQYRIYKNLAELNDMSEPVARRAFLNCCGSTEWARRMASSRPFTLVESLFKASRDIWFSLPSADLLEAFAAHPQIGEPEGTTSRPSQSAQWSSTEQAAVSSASDLLLSELTTVNRLYREKFGFIFIVFATGKTVEEMVAICRARLGNSVETELQIASEEQQKITELRLTKLLER